MSPEGLQAVTILVSLTHSRFKGLGRPSTVPLTNSSGHTPKENTPYTAP